MTPDADELERIIREHWASGPDTVCAAVRQAMAYKRRGPKASKDIDDRCKRAIKLVRKGEARKAVHLVVADDKKTQNAVKRRLDNYYADVLREAEAPP